MVLSHVVLEMLERWAEAKPWKSTVGAPGANDESPVCNKI